MTNAAYKYYVRKKAPYTKTARKPTRFSRGMNGFW